MSFGFSARPCLKNEHGEQSRKTSHIYLLLWPLHTGTHIRHMYINMYITHTVEGHGANINTYSAEYSHSREKIVQLLNSSSFAPVPPFDLCLALTHCGGNEQSEKKVGQVRSLANALQCQLAWVQSNCFFKVYALAILTPPSDRRL